MNDKLNEYYNLIKDLEKRGDAYKLFKSAEDLIISLKDRLNDLEKKYVKFFNC